MKMCLPQKKDKYMKKSYITCLSLIFARAKLELRNNESIHS